MFLLCGALFAACGGDATSGASASDTAVEEPTDAAPSTSVEVAVGQPSPPVAATLTFDDGTEVEIAGETLDEFYDTIDADRDFVTGAFGPNGIPQGFQQSLLGDLVLGAVVDHVLAERSLERSDSALADSRANLESVLRSFLAPDTQDLGPRFESLPYLEHLARLESGLTTLGEAMVAELPPGDVVDVPCSSHILLASETDALEVIGLLEDGGDFAELAMEFSTGPTGPTGGVLGCTDPNGFVPEFRDAIVGAPVGTIIGPVETQFGFHVITVTEIEQQSVGASDPMALASEALTSEIASIDVDVAPELGTWEPVSGQVVPPG